MNVRHVGSSQRDSDIQKYYDPSVLSWISQAVMHKTAGLDKRPISVTCRVIENVLDSFLDTHRPFMGDIHTRFNIPGDGNFSGDFGLDGSTKTSNYIINQVVEFIAETIKSEYEINSNNKRFSAWSALYGANNVGLRSHPPIKLREKRPAPFQFHMKF